MKLLAPFFAILWAGMTLGAGVIATPAKFLAPSLTLPTALEIGRVTFYLVGIAEAALCLSLIIAILAFGGIRWRIVIIPIVLFAIQRIGLMPVLDERTIEMIGGNMIKESNLHNFYIILEFAKFFALIAAGADGMFFIKNDQQMDDVLSSQPPSPIEISDQNEKNHEYPTTKMQVTFVDGALQFA